MEYLLNDLFMGTMSPKTLHCSKEDLSPLGFLTGVRAPTDGVPKGIWQLADVHTDFGNL